MRLSPVSLSLVCLTGCWPYIGANSGDLGDLDLDPDAGDADADADGDADADADGDADSDADTDTEVPSDCTEGPSKTGPWPRHPLADVTVRAAQTNFDAGLDNVIAAAQNHPNPFAVEIEVHGAVVTATLEAPSSPNGEVTFWAADRSGTVVGFRIGVNFDPSTLVPGDVVDLRVTEVQNYFGVIEVTDADLLVTGSGEGVFVADGMTGASLDYAAFPQEQVEVWGKIVSNAEPCGAFECFDLDYGAADKVVVRTEPGTLVRKDCVQIIAPLDVYGEEPQLGIDNPNWLRTF